MPRVPALPAETLRDRAMQIFWLHGYAATSMDALVRGTGSSRQQIYKHFAGKHGLFLACLAAYQDAVVTPAFAAVEAPGAEVHAIANYLHTQIDAAAALGLPGPGCLIANSATECAPHDAAIDGHVQAHHARLQRGFENVFENTAPQLDATARTELAEFVTLAAQGLWSYSRTVTSTAPLRRQADTLLQLIEARTNP